MKAYSIYDLTIASEILSGKELLTVSHLSDASESEQIDHFNVVIAWAEQVVKFFKDLFKLARYYHKKLDWQLSVKGAWQTVKSGKFASLTDAITHIRKLFQTEIRQFCSPPCEQSKLPAHSQVSKVRSKWARHAAYRRATDAVQSSFFRR